MSWSKYHSRYYHHCTCTITGRRSAKFCETRPVLSWTHSASWCWSEFVSISLLGFHCWPKPHSSPHTLQNTGLIKDQFRDINLWGSTYLSPLTSHLTPHTSKLRRWELRWCWLWCCWLCPAFPLSSWTGEWGRAWRLTGGLWTTGDTAGLRGGTVRRTSVILLRTAFYIHITFKLFSFDLFWALRGGGAVKGCENKNQPSALTAPVGGPPPGTSADRVLLLHPPCLYISYQSQINTKHI